MINQDHISAFLDDALDGGSREATELELERDSEALQFILDQRKTDRLLRSALRPVASRERLKESILAAVAGAPTEQLRAQVLADTAGGRARPTVEDSLSTGLGDFIRTWFDDTRGPGPAPPIPGPRNAAGCGAPCAPNNRTPAPHRSDPPTPDRSG